MTYRMSAECGKISSEKDGLGAGALTPEITRGLILPTRPEGRGSIMPSLRNQRMHCSCSCAEDHKRLILSMADTSGECWEWRGTLNRDGYGVFYHRRNWQAHRLSYIAFVGDIPQGLVLDHLCSNRACVNPAHLEPVTDRVNILRSNCTAAINFRKEVCVYGHPLPTRAAGDESHRKCEQCAREMYTRNKARVKSSDISPDDPRHGTPNGYVNLMCRCDRCKVAGAEMNADQGAKRIARGLTPDDPRHGTYNGYTNWKCRCNLCREAGREQYLKSRAAA